MHYSNQPSMVRVDFWKPSGKWYATEEMPFLYGWGENKLLIHEAFKRSLKVCFGNRFSGMDVTCLEPYHEHSRPIQLKAGWNKE